MKMRKTVLALLVCLTLSACGGTQSEENVSLFGQAAELEETSTLLTINGREVPAWYYLYWLDFTCTRLRTRYQEAELPLDWDAPATDGEGTLAGYAKALALTDTALYVTVEAWAEAYGCGFTDEDEETMTALWAKQSAACGGEEAYLAALADRGLDRARAESLTRTGLLYGKLYELYCTERSPLSALSPSPSGLTVNRIFVAAGDDREAARQQAAELFSQLNSAEDQAAAFDSLAAGADDPTGPRALSPGDLPASLEEAAQALEEGQFSGILESEDGFSILFRLPGETVPPDGDRFDQLLEDAAAQADIQTTPAYEAIEPADFVKALDAIRGANIKNP